MAADAKSVDEIIAGWEAIAAKVVRPAKSKKAKRKKGRSLQNLPSFLSKSISNPLSRSSSSANVSEGKKEEKYTPDEAKRVISEQLFIAFLNRAEEFQFNPKTRIEIKHLMNAYYNATRKIAQRENIDAIAQADLQITIDFFKIKKDHPKFNTIRAMIIYADTLDPPEAAGWLRQNNSLSKRLFSNGFFSAFTREEIISEIISSFKAAFCEDKVKHDCEDSILIAAKRNSQLKQGLSKIEEVVLPKFQATEFLHRGITESLNTIFFPSDTDQDSFLGKKTSKTVLEKDKDAPILAQFIFHLIRGEDYVSLDSSSQNQDKDKIGSFTENRPFSQDNVDSNDSTIPAHSQTTETSEDITSTFLEPSQSSTDLSLLAMDDPTFDANNSEDEEDSTAPLLGDKSTPSGGFGLTAPDSSGVRWTEIDLTEKDQKKEETPASTPPITRILNTVSSAVSLSTPQKKSGSPPSAEEKEQNRLKELKKKEAKKRKRKEEDATSSRISHRLRPQDIVQSLPTSIGRLFTPKKASKGEPSPQQKPLDEEQLLLLETDEVTFGFSPEGLARQCEELQEEQKRANEREEKRSGKEELKRKESEPELPKSKEQTNITIPISVNNDAFFKNMRRYLLAEMVINSSKKTPRDSTHRTKGKEKEKKESHSNTPFSPKIEEAAQKLLTHHEWANDAVLTTLDNLEFPSKGYTYTDIEEKMEIILKEESPDIFQNKLTRTKSSNKKEIVTTTLTNTIGCKDIDITISGKSEAVKEEMLNLATMAKMFCEDNCLVIKLTGDKIIEPEYYALLLTAGIIPIFEEYEEEDDTTSIWKTFKHLYDKKDSRKVSEQYLDEVLEGENVLLKEELLNGMFSTIPGARESDKTIQYQGERYTLDDLAAPENNSLIKAIFYPQTPPDKEISLTRSVPTSKEKKKSAKSLFNIFPALFSSRDKKPLLDSSVEDSMTSSMPKPPDEDATDTDTPPLSLPPFSLPLLTQHDKSTPEAPPSPPAITLTTVTPSAKK